MPETKRKRGRPRKQPYLSEEMAPPSIPEIDAAAEEYVSARNARMAYLKDEVESAETLLSLLKKHNLPAYEYEGNIVTISTLEKVKVKRKKDTNANGETEED